MTNSEPMLTEYRNKNWLPKLLKTIISINAKNCRFINRKHGFLSLKREEKNFTECTLTLMHA